MMVSFGLELKDEKAVAKILEIRSKILIEDVVKNPWTGKIVASGRDFFVVVMEPIYPRIYLFAVFPLIVAVFGWGTWWGNIATFITVVMGSMRIFWWEKFYFFLFWIATKKKVKFVSAPETLARVV